MKLLDYFDSFLKQTVNLDETRLARLDRSVEAVSAFLEGSATFKNHFLDTIPQGSYAHKTIIKPVKDNDEFDADILLALTEVDGWEASDYVEHLYTTFRQSGVYKQKVGRKSRCVTVDYAGDFHIDVVPFLERHSQKFITNRYTNDFELTDPEAYNAWLDEKNRITGGALIPVLRLLKYIRDYKDTFSIKSFVLNVLIGEQISAMALLEDEKCYADVPTTLKTVALHLKDYLELHEVLPSIMDPSGTGENLSDRWNQDQYSSFRTSIIRYADWIYDAWSDQDVNSSLAKWQKIFGAEFKQPLSKQVNALASTTSNLPVVFRNTEQHIQRDLGIPVQISTRHFVRVNGKVLRKGSFGEYYLSTRGNKVRQGRFIRFEIESCNVPQPYEIYWKIINRGEQAESLDCIRGEIEKGERTWRVDEYTKFRGSHYVEAYIVKDGICVARDKQLVNII